MPALEYGSRIKRIPRVSSFSIPTATRKACRPPESREARHRHGMQTSVRPRTTGRHLDQLRSRNVAAECSLCGRRFRLRFERQRSNGNAAGTSGAAQPAWSTLTGQATRRHGLTWLCAGWASADLQNLQVQAAGAPYTVQYTDTSGTTHTIPLIGSDDWAYLGTNGLQALSLI